MYGCVLKIAINMCINLFCSRSFFIWVTEIYFHYTFESRELELVIIIALFTYIFELYGQYANVVFTANLQQAKANLPNFIKSLIFHIGRILIVIFFVNNIALKLYSWHLILAILLFLLYIDY